MVTDLLREWPLIVFHEIRHIERFICKNCARAGISEPVSWILARLMYLRSIEQTQKADSWNTREHCTSAPNKRIEQVVKVIQERRKQIRNRHHVPFPKSAHSLRTVVLEFGERGLRKSV